MKNTPRHTGPRAQSVRSRLRSAMTAVISDDGPRRTVNDWAKAFGASARYVYNISQDFNLRLAICRPVHVSSRGEMRVSLGPSGEPRAMISTTALRGAGLQKARKLEYIARRGRILIRLHGAERAPTQPNGEKP